MDIIIWHLLDEPTNTPEGMATVLPLAGLDAAVDYRTLPLPAAPPEDFVRDVFLPAVDGAMPGSVPSGAVLVGGSVSALVALSAAAAGLPVSAVVLISPAPRLRELVDLNAAAYDTKYEWDAETAAAADRLDFVARAAEITVPVLIVSGAEDAPGFRLEAERLWQSLPGGRASLVSVAGMGHGPTAAVDGIVVDWLRGQRSDAG